MILADVNWYAIGNLPILKIIGIFPKIAIYYVYGNISY